MAHLSTGIGLESGLPSGMYSIGLVCRENKQTSRARGSIPGGDENSEKNKRKIVSSGRPGMCI